MVQFDFLAVPFGWDQTWQILLYPGTIFSRWVCLPSSSLLPMYPPGNEGTFQDPEVELKFQEGQLRVAPIAWNSIVPMISFALVLLRRGWRLIWGIFFSCFGPRQWVHDSRLLLMLVFEPHVWYLRGTGLEFYLSHFVYSSLVCPFVITWKAGLWRIADFEKPASFSKVFKCHSFPMKLL